MIFPIQIHRRSALLLSLLLIFFSKGTFGQSTVTIGSGTQTNTTGSYPAPYGNFYEGAKHQMLVRASELSGAGLSAGTITELGFDVDNPSGNALQGFTILMKNVPQNSLSSFDSNLDTVFGPVTYTPGSGWNIHSLDSSFFWDGSSNLLIETCFRNPNWDANATSVSMQRSIMRPMVNLISVTILDPPLPVSSGRT